MKNYILVTGACGFLSKRLIGSLLKNGYKVIGIDKSNDFIPQDGNFNSKDFTYFQFNLKDKLKRFTKKEIKTIFHLASRQPSAPDITYDEYYESNVIASRNILEFCLRNNIPNLVFTSTINISVSGQDKINEESRVQPVNYYCLTKYIAERLFAIGLKNNDKRFVTVRFSSLYGKNQIGGLVHTYYKSALEGKDIIIYNNGRTIRNVMHVNDAVGLLVNIQKKINTLNKYELFVGGSSNSLKNSEIARIIKELMKSSSKIVYVGNNAAVNWNIDVDISKIKKVLRFNPMSIQEGIKKYLEETENEI